MKSELIAAFLASAALVRAAQFSHRAIKACRKQTRRARAMLGDGTPVSDAALTHLSRRCRACGKCVMATSAASEPRRP